MAPNAYTRRKQARKALAEPHRHSVERIVRAASVVNRHHGSTVPLAAANFVKAMTKKYTCPVCAWVEQGSAASKKAKKAGHCKWCPSEPSDSENSVAVPLPSAKAGLKTGQPKATARPPKKVTVDANATVIEPDSSAESATDAEELDAPAQRYRVLKQ